MTLRHRVLTRNTVCLRYWMVAAGLMLTAAGNARVAGAQDECKIVFDAAERQIATPHRNYTTSTMSGGKADAREDIYVDGAVYVLTDGKWKKSVMTVQKMQEQERENRKNAKNTSCRHIRDEAVNGEAAGVYSAHAETDDLKSDSLVWISKSKGLIVREEVDLDVSPDKSHISARSEYANVSAQNVAK